MSETGPEAILARLVSNEVDFVLIGGLAAIAHGSQRVTRDIDVFVEPSNANLARLEAALAELEAVQLLPGGEEGKIESSDLSMVGLGATLHTRSASGRLDIVGAPAGAASYGDVRKRAVTGQISGIQIWISGVNDLVSMKRAAGRPLDLQDVADITESSRPDFER